MKTGLLTPSEISEILNINYRKVLELIKLGKLPAIQIDRQFRINPKDFDDFLKKNKVKGF